MGHQQGQDAANQRQRYGPQQQGRIAEIPKCPVEEKEDDHQAYWDHDGQALHRLLQLLELASPGVAIPLWQTYLLGNFCFSLRNRALQVTATHAELDRDVAHVIFVIDKRGARLLDDLRHLFKRHVRYHLKNSWLKTLAMTDCHDKGKLA